MCCCVNNVSLLQARHPLGTYADVVVHKELDVERAQSSAVPSRSNTELGNLSTASTLNKGCGPEFIAILPPHVVIAAIDDCNA